MAIACHIRQVVGQQRFRGSGHFRHDPAQLSGAHLIRKADGEAGDMAHQRLFHIGGRTERAAVRTDQRNHIDKRCQDGKQHGHPPIAYDPCCQREIRLHFQHFTDDPPQEDEGHQGQHTAQRGEDQRQVRQYLKSARITEQLWQGALLRFFHGDTSFLDTIVRYN